jgi:acyl-CoA-dependent ceramide synthase
MRVHSSDAYLITFWIILFWFVREASMRWIWEPLARWAGVKEKRSVVRFAEQGWNLLYYSVFLTLGVVSAVRSQG